MCILTKMIHVKKVSNFIFSFAPTKLHNLPLCQASLVLTWSHPKPNFNSPPPFHCLCVCPEALRTIICHSIQALFWPSKKERKKERTRWYLYQYPPFPSFAVLILIETKHNTNNDTLPNFAVLTLILKKNLIFTKVFNFLGCYVGSTQTYLRPYKLVNFLDCEFWLIGVSLLVKRDTLALEL